MIFTSPASPLGGCYSQSQSDEQNTDPHGYSIPVKTGTFSLPVDIYEEICHVSMGTSQRKMGLSTHIFPRTCTLGRHLSFNAYQTYITAV